jgi:hypothetical protein
MSGIPQECLDVELSDRSISAEVLLREEPEEEEDDEEEDDDDAEGDDEGYSE